MVKYLVFLLLIGCGNQVSVSNKKLEYNSSLSDGSTTTANTSGMLRRGTPDIVTVNGSSYPVSMYSSYSALEFIAALPMTTQMSVKLKGKIKNNEMVLEIIQAQ